MSKVHLETWTNYRSGIDNHGVCVKGGRVVATRIKSHDEAMLLSAAPDMARALLMRRKCTEPEGQCQQCTAAAERALAKAGIVT